MKNLICVMLVVFLPLTLASQTQNRFRVWVDVYKDTHTANTLESHLKREFRLLGDVDIVEGDENWQFACIVSYLEDELVNGRKTGWITLAGAFYERVPSSYFKADRYVDLRGPAVYVTLPLAATYKQNDLGKYCVARVGSIDKVHLAPIRKLLR